MIHVAVGIIFNQQGEVLITKRSEHSPYPNLWEFPGGKIELNESSESALCRELFEELAITCHQYQFWRQHHHVYPDCEVTLDIYLVTEFSGEVKCMESQQAYRWLPISALSAFDFPEGNKKIISELATEKSLQALMG